MKPRISSHPAVREFRELSALLREAADLSAPELTKRPHRWGVFRQKIDRGEPFILKVKDGSEVSATIPRAGNEVLYSALESEDAGAYKAAFKLGVTAIDPSGASIRIASPSDLRKDAAFGGKGAGAGTSAEGSQIDEIRAAILAARREIGGAVGTPDEDLPPIDIRLGNFVAAGVVGCEKVLGTPKADAVLVDSAGGGVAWISLKSASKPSEMNQWSGVTKLAGEPAVMDFADFVRCIHPGGVPSGKVYSQDLDPSSSLAKAAVWGSARVRGPNGVDAVIATKGRIGLKPAGGGAYEFSVPSGNIWTDGTVPTGDWEPTIIARKGDRDNFGIPKTRVGIFPKGYRKSIDASPGSELRRMRGGECGPARGDRGARVTAETRLLLGELFPRNPLEKWGLTEEYVTQVLGLPRPVLVEGRISESALREIIREHLLFEGWWESAKAAVGSGVAAIKEKGESAADVIKAFGGDSKAVIAALWAAASDPNALTELLQKFVAKAKSKAGEIITSIKAVATKIKIAGVENAAIKALDKALGFVTSAVQSIASLSGWKGMLAAAGGYLGFEWVFDKIEPVIEKIEKLTSGAGEVKKETASQIASAVQDEIVGFLIEQLTEIGKSLSEEAVAQLAGPVAWLNTAFKIFETSAWVVGKLASVISSASQDFASPEIV